MPVELGWAAPLHSLPYGVPQAYSLFSPPHPPTACPSSLKVTDPWSYKFPNPNNAHRSSSWKCQPRRKHNSKTTPAEYRYQKPSVALTRIDNSLPIRLVIAIGHRPQAPAPFQLLHRLSPAWSVAHPPSSFAWSLCLPQPAYQPGTLQLTHPHILVILHLLLPTSPAPFSVFDLHRLNPIPPSLTPTWP